MYLNINGVHLRINTVEEAKGLLGILVEASMKDRGFGSTIIKLIEYLEKNGQPAGKELRMLEILKPATLHVHKQDQLAAEGFNNAAAGLAALGYADHTDAGADAFDRGQPDLVPATGVEESEESEESEEDPDSSFH
jgi:hypothetical protein